MPRAACLRYGVATSNINKKNMLSVNNNNLTKHLLSDEYNQMQNNLKIEMVNKLT